MMNKQKENFFVNNSLVCFLSFLMNERFRYYFFKVMSKIIQRRRKVIKLSTFDFLIFMLMHVNANKLEAEMSDYSH